MFSFDCQSRKSLSLDSPEVRKRISTFESCCVYMLLWSVCRDGLERECCMACRISWRAVYGKQILSVGLLIVSVLYYGVDEDGHILQEIH